MATLWGLGFSLVIARWKFLPRLRGDVTSYLLASVVLYFVREAEDRPSPTSDNVALMRGLLTQGTHQGDLPTVAAKLASCSACT